jgi:hypothetical protein
MTGDIHAAVLRSRVPPHRPILDRPRPAPLRERAAVALVRLARSLDDRAAWCAFAPRPSR